MSSVEDAERRADEIATLLLDNSKRQRTDDFDAHDLVVGVNRVIPNLLREAVEEDPGSRVAQIAQTSTAQLIGMMAAKYCQMFSRPMCECESCTDETCPEWRRDPLYDRAADRAAMWNREVYQMIALVAATMRAEVRPV